MLPYNLETRIGHFTVVCLVTWSWIGSEAGGDLVIQRFSADQNGLVWFSMKT